MEIGFILKQTITFFIEPLGLILSLLIIGIFYLFKQRYLYSKIFISLGFAILVLFSYPPFSNYLVQNLEGKYTKYAYDDKIKYIHVLGSGHNTDISQPLSSQISSIKRVIEGVIIHKRIKDSKLIFTGYKGKTNISNAKMNQKLAIALGVEKGNIIINSKPKDTGEEAKYIKQLLGKKPFILVTSATHMERSIKLFKSLGLHPAPAPTDFYKNEFISFLKFPNINSFSKSSVAIHEYLGIVWNYIEG